MRPRRLRRGNNQKIMLRISPRVRFNEAAATSPRKLVLDDLFRTARSKLQ